jgi:hypothetical protein
MSKVEVNQISSQCGSTLTVGQSGDTVTLAAGATQTGFGRTGTVDWDTTAKTASFTAVSGTGYFVNTTSGAVTMTLPATPSAGDIVSVKDYAYTFATNNLTINRNGSPIGGGSGTDLVYSTNGISKTFIYVDGTKGWLVTNESTDTSSAVTPAYITATGGTVTCCGDYKIHTFTGPGTFCVSCAGNLAGSSTVDYLVIAGGASGGGGSDGAGAGGAGGYRFSNGTASGCYCAGPSPLGASALPVTATGYPITVGGGGSPNPGVTTSRAGCGSVSTFSTITSTGGGSGGLGDITPSPVNKDGLSGGSGGGSGTFSPAPGPTGVGNVGSGNTPPVSPPQGNPGGTGATDNANYRVGGGGGGAGGSGVDVCNPAPAGGAGGAGLASSITASSVTRAGGGGGGGHPSGTRPGGAGGSGGGGTGAQPSPATAGTANTGSGGGGSSYIGGGTASGAGGSGVVIIRYKYQ